MTRIIWSIIVLAAIWAILWIIPRDRPKYMDDEQFKEDMRW